MADIRITINQLWSERNSNVFSRLALRAIISREKTNWQYTLPVR